MKIEIDYPSPLPPPPPIYTPTLSGPLHYYLHRSLALLVRPLKYI